MPDSLKGKQVSERETEKIFFFFGKDSEFSNFYTKPNLFSIGGHSYSSSEQYYHSEKAKFFGDTEASEKIMALSSPKAQKRIRVKGFNQRTWTDMEFNVMKEGVKAKIMQNQCIEDKLKATNKKILAEASPRDAHWGIGC